MSDLNEAIETLALRFNLEASDVEEIVKKRENKTVKNIRSVDVTFIFFNHMNMFRVAAGTERADYQFQGNSFTGFAAPSYGKLRL